MIFARRVFVVASVLGFLIVLPLFFLEERFGRDYPPAITHPEFFYGFVGVATVFQLLYLMVGLDPVRFRPMMIVAALGKASFAVPAVILYLLGRTPQAMLPGAAFDLVFAALFLVAHAKTASSAATMPPGRDDVRR